MAFATPEQKFGIPVRGRPPRTLEQNASIVLGSVYMGAGLFGFLGTGLGGKVTGFSQDTFLFFPLNIYHNIVHIGIAAFWFLGAFALTAAGNEGVNIAIGGIYVLATVIGFMGYLPLLNIHAGSDLDNYLHLATATATIIFGTGLLRVFGGRQAATA